MTIEVFGRPLWAGVLAQLDDEAGWLWLLGGLVLVGFSVVIAIILFNYGKLWLQAFMSNARVRIIELIGMSLRQVNTRVIVEAKIMAMQAGVGTDPETGITTRRLRSRFRPGRSDRSRRSRRSRRRPHKRLPESH